MATKIRFHLDAHIDLEVAKALRRHGVDVTTSNKGAIRTAPDIAQLADIREQVRVIVTDDGDFLRFAAMGESHPGIVMCPRKSRTLREIIRGLILIYEVYSAEEMAGRVEYL